MRFFSSISASWMSLCWIALSFPIASQYSVNIKNETIINSTPFSTKHWINHRFIPEYIVSIINKVAIPGWCCLCFQFAIVANLRILYNLCDEQSQASACKRTDPLWLRVFSNLIADCGLCNLDPGIPLTLWSLGSSILVPVITWYSNWCDWLRFLGQRSEKTRDVFSDRWRRT